MIDQNTQCDVQASSQDFDTIMASFGIGSAPAAGTPLFDEKTEAYCAELLQHITGWQAQNNEDRLLYADATKTYGYAKREALIKAAEIKLYNALHVGDSINEDMAQSYVHPVGERANNNYNQASDDMTIGNPQGSDFTKMLLNNDFKGVLCSVSNTSDNDAMRDICSKRIVSYDDCSFTDQDGEKWKCAVPIKVSRLTQQDL